MTRGIQDCGVDPIAYKRGNELEVGDKVSVWWMPKGARFIEALPYRGPFKFVKFIGRFEKVPSAGAPKHYADMSVTDSCTFPIMP